MTDRTPGSTRVWPWLAIGLGVVLALGGGGFAVVGVDYSWTFYWIGFSALILGVVLVIAGGGEPPLSGHRSTPEGFGYGYESAGAWTAA